MSGPGAGLPSGEGGERRAPTPLYCVECLVAGLPKELARIGEQETVYQNEHGYVCSSCGFENNLIAMQRQWDVNPRLEDVE